MDKIYSAHRTSCGYFVFQIDGVTQKRYRTAAECFVDIRRQWEAKEAEAAKLQREADQLREASQHLAREFAT